MRVCVLFEREKCELNNDGDKSECFNLRFVLGMVICTPDGLPPVDLGWVKVAPLGCLALRLMNLSHFLMLPLL